MTSCAPGTGFPCSLSPLRTSSCSLDQANTVRRLDVGILHASRYFAMVVPANRHEDGIDREKVDPARS